MLNNLIYANTSAGIVVVSTAGGQIVNNTVYDAVDVQNNSSGIYLRNNILWAQAGYDLNVSADSQQGLNSDFNDLYFTGTGQLAQWGANAIAELVDWQYELNFDRHSLSFDPATTRPSATRLLPAAACSI